MLCSEERTFEKRVQTTRLGVGLAVTGSLTPHAIDRTARAVAAFFHEAKGADRIFAFATAAVRSAKNGQEFTARVKELCGLTVDVVPGEEEARLASLGALGTKEGCVIDIGGASTEVCCLEGGRTLSRSFDVGAVRLHDVCGEDREKWERFVRFDGLAPLSVEGRTYAVGGTASTLACLKLKLGQYDASRVQDCPITRKEAEEWTERLRALPVQERKSLAGMDASRADIIACGAYLLFSVMRAMRLPVVYASDRDNLEGYLVMRGLI